MKNITYISASAGSGKTFELTERLKNAILEGKTKPEEVILTTFTKAAASEFKEKAKAKFYEAGEIDKADRLDQALIGTVDSVANVFVNRYWYLLGISPKLNVISEEDEQVYISESLSSLPTKEQNKFFGQFAETFKILEMHENGIKYGIDYGFWKNDLKQIFNASRSYGVKDYEQSIAASKQLIQSVTLSHSTLNFDRDQLLARLSALDLISQGDRPGAARENRIAETDKFRRIVSNPEKTQLEIGFALFDMISKGKYTTKNYLESSDYMELEQESKKVWTCEEIRTLLSTYVDYLFDIAAKWQKKYTQYKKEQHIIDYTDMEEYFLKLITENDYSCVQKDVTASYKYLFVDEFQDCSPTQIKIFDRLSDLVEKTIWVGDYKQAIYGFRGSDTALVKAITDRIEMLNGTPNQTLDTSHRSWPPVVDVNNKVFVPVFNDILREDEVFLKKWDKLEAKYEKNKRDCLKIWTLTEKTKGNKSAQIAANIARLIKEEGFSPKDIAVLARSNSELSYMASKLKEYNIPTLTGDSDFQSSREITLLTSLLSLVVNPADTMARASIAFLTQEGFDAAKILDNRFEALSNDKKDWDYLEEVPLIKTLMAKRNHYRYQSVAALVESLIIELDLYNCVKQWPDSDNSENTLYTAISTAHTYEDHCIQMSLPCTIYGFIDYLNTVSIKAAGASDGVQLFTYHGSKGLEWKIVILLSLGDDILDDNEMIAYNVYGVHTYHEQDPDAQNPYPPMLITVLPWIFGSKASAPENVQNLIFQNPRYNSIKNTSVQEEKRLMYVAMTRPVESLILTATEENGLKRLQNMGVKALDSIPQQNSADVLGIKMPFTIESPADMGEWKFTSPENQLLKLYSGEKNYQKRDIQPSSCKSESKVTAKIVLDTGKRITLKAGNEIMDKTGTCIHNIFCVLEQNPSTKIAEKIIKEHGLSLQLPDSEEIVEAWKNLETFLKDNYGPKIASYHELPFKQSWKNQIFTGSIDFIWETENGVVLIDFKSYPGNKNDVINPEHEHFAGMYAGQFECYERALKAAGKKVLAKIIYYHVLGTAVQLS